MPGPAVRIALPMRYVAIDWLSVFYGLNERMAPLAYMG